jgi:hypothetical protein
MSEVKDRPAVQQDYSRAETDDAVLESGATVYTVAQARAIVKHMAEVTTTKDPEAFANGHTEDCIVGFIRGPMLRGRRELRDFMASRFGPDRVDYVCEKTLRTLNGNVFGVQWENRWTDRDTGKKIRTRGIEFWIMRGEQVARWDGAVNFWEE